MDFKFSHEEETFRQEVKEFLDKELPPDWVGYVGGTMAFLHSETDEEWEFFKRMTRKLGQKGWLALTWPKEYGGQARPHVESLILDEEMVYRGGNMINGAGAKMLAPTLIEYGTEEQKNQHLPGIAAGEKDWCQGFSEPEAGSDLASVQTRAVEDGNYFTINGQKTWTSIAHRADWCFMLARTDTQLPRHRGLSFFLVDMTTPGITVHPIKDMLGNTELNEVFFEDVRAPRENMVGDKNQGFYIAMALLNYERTDIGPVATARRIIDDLISYMKVNQTKEESPTQNRLARNTLAEMAIDTEIARLLCYQVAWQQDKGIATEWGAAMARMYPIQMIKRVANGAMKLLGLYGQLAKTSKWAPVWGKIEHLYLNSFEGSFAGGTAEIQRTIIATRGLGLPRG